MSRYEWPRDYVKSPDRLLRRTEHNLRGRELGSSVLDSNQLRELVTLQKNRQFPEKSWVPLGPSILLGGQADGFPMVAGRIRDLWVNSSGTRAYAGSANGGVWYYEVSHGAWRPVGSWGLDPDRMNDGDRTELSLSTGALLVQFGDGDDPNKDIVYVGTGELIPYYHGYPGANHGGAGVLRLSKTITEALASPGGSPWEREAENLIGSGIFRLAFDPVPDQKLTSTKTLVAATSKGLFYRKGTFQAGQEWSKVKKKQFDSSFFDDDFVVTDIHWHIKSGLWIAVKDGPAGLFRAATGPDQSANFKKIELPQVDTRSRLALGFPKNINDRFYVLGKKDGQGRGYSALWRVDYDLPNNTAKATLVEHVPRALFSSLNHFDKRKKLITEKDQSNYDMAIEVEPNSPIGTDVVYIGGSATKSRNGVFNAALFRLEITKSGGGYQANFAVNENRKVDDTMSGQSKTYFGEGIHADVHQILNRPNGVWVSCDGGVFRRNQIGKVDPLNVGLAVLEPGYLSNHPVFDGTVLAGLQDNGSIQKTGDTVWYRRTYGDGGGVAFHPRKKFPMLYLEQHTNASWHFHEIRKGSDQERASSTASLHLDSQMRAPPFVKSDKDNATFYSRAATAPSTGDTAQVCIGTDRLWYCNNWGATGGKNKVWVTIPSNTEPKDSFFSFLPGIPSKSDQDRIGKVLVVRFADPGKAVPAVAPKSPQMTAKILALTTKSVFQFTFDVGTGWTSISEAKISGDLPFSECKDEDAKPFLKYLPKRQGMALTDVTPHVPKQGSCYVSTTGKTRLRQGVLSMAETYDTLWWYDGEGRWYPTGLVNAPVDTANSTMGIRASAHSVIVDPDGLPDFDAVTGPAIVTNANRRDLVYVGTKIGVWRGRLTFVDNPAHADDTEEPKWIPSWEWRPYLDGLPQAIVEELEFFVDTSIVDGVNRNIKLLRAAIVSRGIWELDLSPPPTSVGQTYLRSYGIDTGRRPIKALTTNPYSADPEPDPHAFSPDIIAIERVFHDMLDDSWAAPYPNEAEMLDLRRKATSLVRTTAFLSPANVAYVMVHHRHIKAIEPVDVKVHLFAWKNRPYEADGKTPIPMHRLPLTAAIRNAILGVVQGGTPPIPAELMYIGFGSPNLGIDARMPRPVRFEFDLDYPFSGSLVLDTVILIAVVDTPNNTLTAADLNHANLVKVTQQTSLVAAARFNRYSSSAAPDPIIV